MNRRKYIGLCLLALFLLLLGVPVWLTYQQMRQERLDRDLIAAIKRRDVPAGLAALNAGADPNSRDDNSKPLSFWQSLCRLFTGMGRHGKPSPPQPGQPVLLLALDINDSDRRLKNFSFCLRLSEP